MAEGMETTSFEDIRIELPLPMDIVATLINVIGLTYPGAVIKQGAGASRLDNRLVIGIPKAERHKSAKKAEKYAKRKAFLDADTEAFISELGPGAISMGLPEYLANIMTAMARTWFEFHPDAKNYIEVKVRDRAEPFNEWVFAVARSEGQTPHALRAKAEADVAVVQEQLAAAQARIDELEQQVASS
jgi:hypothetical protein